MPYDGNGNYVRAHNWAADAANALDINATEMDAEDNGFGAALSNAVTRDGQGKMGVDFLPNADNTLNLGSGAMRWATINGLPINSIISGIFYARTAAEITAAVTPVTFTYPPGHVLRYGTNATPGTTLMTTAIQAAVNQLISGGAPVYAPAGTYLTGTINLPVSQYGFKFFGDGPSLTIFQASAPNIPLFQKATSAGALEGAEIGGFSIKANAAGSTTSAFLCTGFRTSKFTNIRGLSNGSFGFASLFSLSATPYLCYGNEFDSCGLANATGWAKVWDFNNAATGVAANNANITIILNPWIYFNTGLSVGIDAQRSTKTSIIGGLIESNTGATAINSGNTTTIQGVWMEANAADIAYNNAVDGVANGGVALNNYFSTAHTVSFASCSGNAWINNTEAGLQTWTGNNGTNVRFQGSGDAAVAPTVALTSGGTGTLTFGSATQLSEPNLANVIWYSLAYNWTPTTAATFSLFTVTPPANWELVSLSTGSTRNASGQPRVCSPSGASIFSHDNVTNDAHAIALFVAIKHIDT